MFSSLVLAGSPAPERARGLYTEGQYRESLSVLETIKPETAEAFELVGQDEYMLGEYKKACEAFQKAAALAPGNAGIYRWLGLAYGRRAESSNPFTAPGEAAKARENFERAVKLDPSNKEALSNLFDFYLRAPGYIGGGVDKAEKLVAAIEKLDPAEGYYAQAELDEKRKQYRQAEQHLRAAIDLAPQQAGRIVDLARFLAKRGRTRESDELFDRALRLAPDNPKVLYARAETYIRERRNLGEARKLLEKYLRSPLTADDPPRAHAEALLKKAGA